jgi:hypothetical protein
MCGFESVLCRYVSNVTYCLIDVVILFACFLLMYVLELFHIVVRFYADNQKGESSAPFFVWVRYMASSEKLLTCLFSLDVLCSSRKTEQSGIMDRCFKCEHYARFVREMEMEDEAIDREVEDAFANPEKYLRGQDDDRR